jgi:mannan endo-1,4-beta-mannosidase
MSRKYLFLILLFCLRVNLLQSQESANDASWPIIIRKGDKLFEGDKAFRFLGMAAPNIQANENQVRVDRTNRFPDDYEISDILDGIRREGGRATRTFSLSVFHPDDKGMPVYFSGHRQYNEEAFRCLDRIIALGHKYDVRLIIPFIASQSFASVRAEGRFQAFPRLYFEPEKHGKRYFV